MSDDFAVVAIDSGDQPAAVEFCKRLVEIDPDTFEGWSNLRFAHQQFTKQKTRPAQPARSIA